MINDQEEWEKYRKWAATCVAMYASYAVSLVSILHCRDHIRKSISEQGDYERYALIKRLTTLEDADCRSQLRMSKDAFATLVSMLKRTQFLRDNPQSKVEEQVAKFLHIIGHNLRNRTIKFFYRRSGETVSRHFHQVLKAIISLEDIFLKQPDGFNCPPEIRNNPKYWPYFKDCVGAIDGTHFRVRVPNKDAQRYRGRKCYPTQNALAACSFDLKFTYILPGWEGSASDSRILDNALTREMDKFIVPQGVEGDRECSVEIDKKHLKWNNQMDIVLIDSLLDQMLKGQKIGGSFTSSAYRAASNAVSTKFSVHCDSSHVRNRLKTLKRNLAMAKDMLTTDSGFGYNHSTQLIEATAGVWAAYLKAKPKASQFRHAPIQNFQKLCQLFEKDRATGSLAIGPKEKRLRLAGQQILLDDENTDHTESLSENFDGIGTQDDQTAEVSCSSNSKKRKNKLGNTLSKEIRSIKEGLDAVAAALDRGNLRNYTNGQLFEEIEKVSGMSDASRMKMYQVLAKEVSDARAYLECPIERRGLWLFVKFGNSIFDARKEKEMIGFINGTTKAPARKVIVDGRELENKEYESWKKSNDLVRKWIRDTITDDNWYGTPTHTATALVPAPAPAFTRAIARARARIRARIRAFAASAQPKRVLLYRPPGTGKTLLARVVAHHTDCTFIRVSGSELVQKKIPGNAPGKIAAGLAWKTSVNATKGGVSSVCQPLPPDRPLWFPGSSPPESLDSSLPGDFGFDPLGLELDDWVLCRVRLKGNMSKNTWEARDSPEKELTGYLPKAEELPSAHAYPNTNIIADYGHRGCQVLASILARQPLPKIESISSGIFQTSDDGNNSGSLYEIGSDKGSSILADSFFDTIFSAQNGKSNEGIRYENLLLSTKTVTSNKDNEDLPQVNTLNINDMNSYIQNQSQQ
ncbi:unnamed protein product [Camellia sinensis]